MKIRLPESLWARLALVVGPLLLVWVIVRVAAPVEVQSTPVVSVFPSQTL